MVNSVKICQVLISIWHNLAIRRVRRTVPVPSSRHPSRNPCWNLQESLQLSRTKNSLMPSEVQLNLADLAGPSSQNLPKLLGGIPTLKNDGVKVNGKDYISHIIMKWKIKLMFSSQPHRCRPWVSQNERNKTSLKPPTFNHQMVIFRNMFQNRRMVSTCFKITITNNHRWNHQSLHRKNPVASLKTTAAQLGQARSNLPVQGADEMVEQAPCHTPNSNGGFTMRVSSKWAMNGIKNWDIPSGKLT